MILRSTPIRNSGKKARKWARSCRDPNGGLVEDDYRERDYALGLLNQGCTLLKLRVEASVGR